MFLNILIVLAKPLIFIAVNTVLVFISTIFQVFYNMHLSKKKIFLKLYKFETEFLQL